MRQKIYRIELNDLELGQVLDGLECRLKAWEATAAYHCTGHAPVGVVIEECDDATEAENLADCYRTIITKLTSQRNQQDHETQSK